MAKRTRQAVVVSSEGDLDESKRYSNVELFNADGTPFAGEGASLPATATAQELEDGTEEELRMVSPKLIHDEIARQIAAL